MSQPQRDDDGAGCLLLFGVILVIAAVVAALLSVAALVDPFAWMPSAGEMWSDCESTDATGCDLDERFPGIWGHAAVNLVYTVGAMVTCGLVLGAAFALRAARSDRFDDAAALERYRAARAEFVGALVAGVLVAATPIAVAIA
jgi:hypothetical protein